MPRYASRAVALTILLAGVLSTSAQTYRDQSLDLLRFLATKPWGGHRWDRTPRFDADLDRFNKERWLKPKPSPDDSRNYDDDTAKTDTSMVKEDLNAEVPRNWGSSSKRSAVATALNGRRRRQPAPALGKAVTPYLGVGILNDVETFFDSLRGNLEGLASLSPQQRTTLFTEPPTVLRALSSGGGGGGGTGIRRLHALRPLRPTGIRSFVETDGIYPGANQHDPGLLWTGLGR